MRGREAAGSQPVLCPRYSVSDMTLIDLSQHTRWKVNAYSWAASRDLAKALDLPLVAAMVLAGRGFADPQEARQFIAGEAYIPDPFLFSHMEGAVAAISDAIDRGGRVVVHGDYDADGVTDGLGREGVDAFSSGVDHG